MRIEKPIPEEIQEQVMKAFEQRRQELRQEKYAEITFIVCTLACFVIIIIAAMIYG